MLSATRAQAAQIVARLGKILRSRVGVFAVAQQTQLDVSLRILVLRNPHSDCFDFRQHGGEFGLLTVPLSELYDEL
ncbi:MAG TPA: hypothetical protein VMR17_12825, partial [Xanthobacteraceae bacterium]|nr:hypothetical protein [Xanthobacteraceae bacterium]